MEKIKRMLEKQGISASLQRVLIYDHMLKLKGHPTAEEVYSALSREIPTLSKTTVYNTLKLFSQKGLLRKMIVNGTEHRYEANMRYHGHFQCRDCGRIYDVELDSNELFEMEEIDGHQVEETEILFRGKCRECREG